MEENKEGMSIQKIEIGTTIHPIDAISVNGKGVTDKIENDSNNIPTSKAVYDVVGDIETLLSNI